MKSSTFHGVLSRTERALTGAAAVTLSLATTTVIAAAFQGAALTNESGLIASIGRAFFG